MIEIIDKENKTNIVCEFTIDEYEDLLNLIDLGMEWLNENGYSTAYKAYEPLWELCMSKVETKEFLESYGE